MAAPNSSPQTGPVKDGGRTYGPYTGATNPKPATEAGPSVISGPSGSTKPNQPDNENVALTRAELHELPEFKDLRRELTGSLQLSYAIQQTGDPKPVTHKSETYEEWETKYYGRVLGSFNSEETLAAVLSMSVRKVTEKFRASGHPGNVFNGRYSLRPLFSRLESENTDLERSLSNWRQSPDALNSLNLRRESLILARTVESRMNFLEYWVRDARQPHTKAQAAEALVGARV